MKLIVGVDIGFTRKAAKAYRISRHALVASLGMADEKGLNRFGNEVGKFLVY